MAQWNPATTSMMAIIFWEIFLCVETATLHIEEELKEVRLFGDVQRESKRAKISTLIRPL